MDIIIDIDGTLSDPEHRLELIRDRDPPQWDAFYDAAENDPALNVLCDLVQQLMGEANRIVFVTGRVERIRKPTDKWLCHHLDCVTTDYLMMMRRDGDHRKDDIVKAEMLMSLRQLGFNPVMAIEDRARIAEMYRTEGLVVLQCAKGDY